VADDEAFSCIDAIEACPGGHDAQLSGWCRLNKAGSPWCWPPLLWPSKPAEGMEANISAVDDDRRPPRRLALATERVIQHVSSGELGFNGTPASVGVGLSGRADNQSGFLAAFAGPLSAFDQPALLSGFGQFIMLSGYFLDCKVSPCAPIAHFLRLGDRRALILEAFRSTDALPYQSAPFSWLALMKC